MGLEIFSGFGSSYFKMELLTFIGLQVESLFLNALDY